MHLLAGCPGRNDRRVWAADIARGFESGDAMTETPEISPDEASEIAAALLLARETGETIPVSRPRLQPTTVAGGYAVQQAMYDQLTARGIRQIGYKCAATSEASRKTVGLRHPFYGRLYDAWSTPSGLAVPHRPALLKAFEIEVGLILESDLPTDGSVTADMVEAATGAILPAVEIVGSPLDPLFDAGGPNLIGDDGCHAHWIHGDELSDWSNIDLMTNPTSLHVDGVEVVTGSGAEVEGGPFGSTAWLANALADHGGGLCAGDRVTTGTTIKPHPVSGTDIVADLGPIGRIEFRM